ncbi:uncharacterized protein LOC110032503 [Phalaenopsis equestris]|uniref:uncharacterized protein LOC110032503 n=1 Tax=Phalaenopsis equestris TaxID=78828 RepID=UPI0009E631E8|nr:uncharacterized protein LOC110032503 [Phalaenopsis equestris]
MDTPLATAVHKENVRIDGGKATVTMKPDKLKTAKTAGKVRKALEDLRSTNLLVVGASKDVDLKQKSTRKGNEAEKNQMTKRHLVTGQTKVANLNNKSVLQGNYVEGNKPFDHILTDEEIKKCYEWAKDGIEGMGGYSWSAKDETNFVMKQTLSEIMASAIGVPVSELEQPFTSEEEGYETDDSEFKISVPGRSFISLYTR